MIEMTEDEKERGFIELTLLPEQAERINEMLEPRGFMISPPAHFKGHDYPVRCLTFTEETAHESQG